MTTAAACHAAMPDDALNVNKMNVNPGGKQQVMRDGWWDGKPQRMTYQPWHSKRPAGGPGGKRNQYTQDAS